MKMVKNKRMFDKRIIYIFAAFINVASVATKFIKVRLSVRVQHNSFGSDVDEPLVLAGAIYF